MDDDRLQQQLQEAAKLIRSAESILFITGAGISADSGLPTYRGVGGLYEGQVTEDGVRIEQALSVGMFRKRPELTIKYLLQVGRAVAAHTFNPAHSVIAALEQANKRVWVLTQNIDGYHVAAGSKKVIEVHGSMWRIRCDSCKRIEPLDNISERLTLPVCPECSNPMRPDVVLFDEMLPLAAVEQLDSQLRTGFELIVSVGTSNQFAYIVHPVLSAVRSGIPVIEINPAESTDLSAVVDLHIRMGAAKSLSAIAGHLGMKLDGGD